MSQTVSLDLDAISRAAERHGVAELELFGSAVSGDFATDSDVDFLVVFLPDRADPFEDFCALRDELCQIVERDVDLVVKRAIRNPYFRESALAHTETVYVAHL
ncbi:toxin-antitoxin system toxin subunit [Kocuria tytonicola]|uniref:Toxin-antitoxin system toxin subunit n=1 Tax=Kocuria tytonicola TaxID=2055946 RepID=A0A3L9L719_9MICC|nr:nucleotidyltransferase domain-containing protein [Kocuria tytonicola]RLY94495.1 toxin-antitoxin system toxin subunit [Kocuria tytonicola]